MNMNKSKKVLEDVDENQKENIENKENKENITTEEVDKEEITNKVINNKRIVKKETSQEENKKTRRKRLNIRTIVIIGIILLGVVVTLIYIDGQKNHNIEEDFIIKRKYKDGMLKREYEKYAYNIYIDKDRNEFKGKFQKEYVDKVSDICGKKLQGVELIIDRIAEDNIGGHFVYVRVQQIKDGILIGYDQYNIEFKNGEQYVGNYDDIGLEDDIDILERKVYREGIDKRGLLEEKELKEITHKKAKEHNDEMYKYKDGRIEVWYYTVYNNGVYEYMCTINETSYIRVNAKTGEIIEEYYSNGIEY